MVTKRKENCCKGRTKAGNLCRAAATAGGLCFFHANPNKASELGRDRRQKHELCCGRKRPSTAYTGQCDCGPGCGSAFDSGCSCGQSSPQGRR